MSDRPTSTIQEVAMETGGIPTSGERFQHDVDLARDAAYALEGAVADPDSIVSVADTTDQTKVTFFLEATEREIGRSRLDTLCGEAGILNRAGLEAMLRVEVARAHARERAEVERREAGQSVPQGYVVVSIDVDSLKLVNDAATHAAGDALILGAGKAIRETFREASDIAGRYGGDEFAVLVPVPNEEMARHVMEEGLRNRRGESVPGAIQKLEQQAEELRAVLRKRFPKFPKDSEDTDGQRGKRPGVMSVGWHYFSAAEFARRYQEFQEGNVKEGSFLQALLREADEKMYRMKHAGS